VSGAAQRWVAVAHILRPRGNKGEVAAELLTDFPQRLTELREAFIGGTGSSSEPERIAIRNCWLSQNHPGQAVFHFEGCLSINAAEKFRGRDVLLPIEQRVGLPAGQYFISDLIGCSVFELPPESSSVVASSPCSMSTAPALLGSVADVQFTGEGASGTPLLVVDTREGELLIPLAEDICTRIDTTGRRIDVSLPDGLRELNKS
jgi:16S rRNA processing protein RimM